MHTSGAGAESNRRNSGGTQPGDARGGTDLRTFRERMQTMEQTEGRMGKEDGFKDEVFIIIPTEAFSDFAGHPLVKAAYLTDVGYFPHARAHYKERIHGTDSCILIYCVEGSGTIEVEGKTFQIGQSDAFCIPRGMAHRYYADSKNPWSILWVHFKGENLKYFPLDTCRTVHMKSRQSDSRMMYLFGLLFRVLRKNYTLGNFIYISQVLSLILSEVYYREKNDEITTQNRHVTIVVRYMYENIARDLTLEDISREVRLSKSYLNVIFKKYAGRAPIDFFIRLRIGEACKLLRQENSRVYEVSMLMGYTDPYYFSRIFRKITGMSPREYKNSSIGNYGAVQYDSP